MTRRRDLYTDARMMHAKGGKTRWRNRVVEILGHPDWTPWAWRIVEAHVRTLSDNAPLVTIAETATLAAHLVARDSLGLPPHRLHDWRHTYAVSAIKCGEDHQAVKRQLGHAPDSTMLYTTYGAYLEDAPRHAERSEPAGSERKRARKSARDRIRFRMHPTKDFTRT